MDTKIITLRYAPELGVIDDAPLRALGRDHEILTVREHFFIAQDLPHLLCVISCRPRATARPSAPPVDTKPPVAKRSSTSAPPEDLGEDDRNLYDAIRRWRATEAERAGVPRYVVLTNRDVETLVRTRPDTLAALRQTPGIGKAKIEKYGEALLELLHPARHMQDAPRLVPDPPPEEVQP